MKKLLLCAVAASTLGGCAAAGGEEKTYAMHAEDARRILLSTDFERGILPGSSKLKPQVRVNYEGTLEWQVLDDSQNGSGWWCLLAIEPVGNDGKTIRVVNQCEGIMARQNNEVLNELVDAALTDRKPTFAQPAG
ncbi:MAG: hypothetical protein Q7T68_03850 [Sphingopyxis sp.]|nr:hypothetical protein [Sphingopyxis sp.]